MSNRRISVDENYLNNLENKLEGIIQKLEKIESNKVHAGSKNGVEIEPHIQDLIPWLKNIDKRRIGTCQGCGLSFIGNQIAQKTCSSVCRNIAFKNTQKAKKLKEAKSYLETLCPSEKGDDNAKI